MNNQQRIFRNQVGSRQTSVKTWLYQKMGSWAAFAFKAGCGVFQSPHLTVFNVSQEKAVESDLGLKAGS